MRYLGGSSLEPPLADDPGIILFLFFPFASATAFLSLSWLMAALTNSLNDRLVNMPKRSYRWMVSPTWYKLVFFSFMSTWYDLYWARVLNYLV
jgi:hypothetical protein